MKKMLILVLIVFTFFGCAQPPTPEQVANADYGRQISYDEADTIVKNWFQTRLKDPQSAQYDIGSPNKGWWANSIVFGGGKFYGYIVDVSINAKNSYGGYTGNQAYKFVIKDGRVISASAQDRKSGAFLPAN